MTYTGQHFQQTPHVPPWRASHGAPTLSYMKTICCVVSGFDCTTHHRTMARGWRTSLSGQIEIELQLHFQHLKFVSFSSYRIHTGRHSSKHPVISYAHTVQSWYNAAILSISFIVNTPMARSWGWDMGMCYEVIFDQCMLELVHDVTIFM